MLNNKRNLFVLALSVVTIILSASTNLYAGAWVLPKGQLYMELYSKYYYADSDFDSDGTGKIPKANNGAYHETYLEYKFEYGLFDKVNLLFSIPYKFALSEDDNGEHRNTGLADVWTGVKLNILEKPIVTSLQFRVKFPTMYDKNESPALGTEYIDGEAKILLGKSFITIPSFIGVELGYRGRGGKNTDDEIPYFVEAGYFPTKRIMLKATLDGVEGLAGTGPEEDYAKWGVAAAYSFVGGFSSVTRAEKSFNIELGYNNTFKGKNTGVGSEGVVKASYQF